MKTTEEIIQTNGPHFNMIEAGNKVVEALSIMKTEQLSYVIVTKEGQYAGILSERDYAQKVILMNRASHSTNVEDVMSSNLPMISLTDSVEKCMMLMNAYKTRYLPVFDGFDFRAVITMNDLVLTSIDSNEHDDLLKVRRERIF